MKIHKDCYKTIAVVWLIVSCTMKEPPYLSSLRILLSDHHQDAAKLERRLRAQPGVSSVFIVPEEKSAYVKIDSKVTNRVELEALVASV